MSRYVQQLSFLQLPNKNPETGFGPACGRPCLRVGLTPGPGRGNERITAKIQSIFVTVQAVIASRRRSNLPVTFGDCFAIYDGSQ